MNLIISDTLMPGIDYSPSLADPNRLCSRLRGLEVVAKICIERFPPEGILMDDREPIDVVYTWVDGGGAGFEEMLRAYWHEAAATSDRHGRGSLRFRDNDELRFSLRSLFQHAEWFRKIYLVTSGQVPKWLNVSHSRLRLITHEDIFADPSVLPTFNSFSIESQLWRIPELSHRFLYFNDDFFLGSTVTRDDFLTVAGGQRIYLENFDIPSASRARNATDLALDHTQALLNRRLPAKRRRKICHIPHLYDKAVIAELSAVWGREMERTAAHRFRQPDDLALETLYYHYLLEAPEHRCFHEAIEASRLPSLYAFLDVDPQPYLVAASLNAIFHCRPKFFCLNDGLDGGSPALCNTIRNGVSAFLRAYFPEPSPLELDG